MSLMMLTQLPRALMKDYEGQTSYDRIYRLVIDGKVPAEKDIGGRWIVKSEDLPAYAAKLGLTEKSNG